MKRLRLPLLVLTLLGFLFAFFYRQENSVRVETVWLQSRLIGRSIPYNVLLPRGYRLPTRWRLRYPVLYLLHGHTGNYRSWISQTSLQQYLSAHSIIVVTPEGETGWYTDSDTEAAARHETFVVKELIPDVESRYRAIADRNGRAVSGYSMGGYGALKFGLKYPEMFVLAASISGAFDAPTRTDDPSIMKTFGPLGSTAREANNLASLAKVQTQLRPLLYFDCGKDDPWLRVNRELHETFLRQGIDHNYRELRGGHDWAYWDRQVREVLELAASKLTPARPRE